MGRSQVSGNNKLGEWFFNSARAFERQERAINGILGK